MFKSKWFLEYSYSRISSKLVYKLNATYLVDQIVANFLTTCLVILTVFSFLFFKNPCILFLPKKVAVRQLLKHEKLRGFFIVLKNNV